MPVVRFKLKADPGFTEHELDEGATSISVARLKEVITMVKLKGSAGAFGLKLSNITTGEEYVFDDDNVPADASVLIKRVPAASQSAAKKGTMQSQPASCSRRRSAGKRMQAWSSRRDVARNARKATRSRRSQQARRSRQRALSNL